MFFIEDFWRLSVGRDYILCGVFKKRSFGGIGYIRVLAYFFKGQKIIRCIELNLINLIYNYIYKFNKFCYIIGKLNYYIKFLII